MSLLGCSCVCINEVSHCTVAAPWPLTLAELAVVASSVTVTCSSSACGVKFAEK